MKVINKNVVYLPGDFRYEDSLEGNYNVERTLSNGDEMRRISELIDNKCNNPITALQVAKDEGLDFDKLMVADKLYEGEMLCIKIRSQLRERIFKMSEEQFGM